MRCASALGYGCVYVHGWQANIMWSQNHAQGSFEIVA
jgi:hypothetical protein